MSDTAHPPLGADVVIVGAGFSRAVSECFGLTEELGQAAIEKAGLPSDMRPGREERFESWLSRLAEDQPYRPAAESLEARAQFLRLATSVAEVVAEWEARAFASTPPTWLEDLLSVLHVRRGIIISFNYDHVIECGVEGHCLMDRAAEVRVRAADVLARLPLCATYLEEEERTYPVPWPGNLLGQDPKLMPSGWLPETFRLVKLHGSLSWYWDPGDHLGITLQRWRVPGRFGDYVPADEAERRRSLPSREPFVVPPTATKSPYLTNLVTRELWKTAREALSVASRVVLLGYSLPGEDQVVQGLLAETLRHRNVKVVVANYTPEPVVERLRALDVVQHADQVCCFSGAESIADFSTWYRDEQARITAIRLSEELTRLFESHADTPEGNPPLDGQILVRWGSCENMSCDTGASRIGHVGGLDLNWYQQSGNADGVVEIHMAGMGSANSVQQDAVQRLAELLRQRTRPPTLVAVTPDGHSFPVIDYQFRSSIPPSTAAFIDPSHHLHLFPAGHPRPGS